VRTRNVTGYVADARWKKKFPVSKGRCAMAYSKQIIVQFLEGVGDTEIKDGSQAMNTRAANAGLSSSVVSVRASSSLLHTFSQKDKDVLTNAFNNFPTDSRVYIRGHGDWESQKVGRWSADKVADFLVECGMPAVRLISITGCELGRDKGSANDTRVRTSMNSFASKFHVRLKKKHKIKTVVYARIYCVGVALASQGHDPGDVGMKGTFNKDDDWETWDEGAGRNRVHSKLKFYWDGNTQKRVWRT
jgi:hypothetical protein